MAEGKLAFKAYRRDPGGRTIPGGSSISGILNCSVDSMKFRTIKIPTNWGCKAVLGKLRSGAKWKARRVGETAYVTITESVAIDIALKGGENLFQVRTVSGADVFELLMLD